MTQTPSASPSSDIAFTPAVKAAQEQRSDRPVHTRIAAAGGFRTGVTADLVAFLGTVDTAFLATASADGQPYVQHRGGPPGFIRAVDGSTLGIADYSGNRQYVTIGNLSENARAFLFLIDYAARRRVKIWGTAQVVEGDPDLVARLMPEGYGARPERALLFHVSAWDVNCPQHIPQKLDAALVRQALETREIRISELEAEVKLLRAQLAVHR
ncbi:pyridoxamine 5'-phosphate oxidase family protein [Xanthobacter sp. V3C-3]|uniref:pyridoxamine 5'-phosphate oxidase family protein n=1 Tax=Xanthobacter lutulentifluminis TaxID=3119935 RepID=UPI003728D87E